MVLARYMYIHMQIPIDKCVPGVRVPSPFVQHQFHGKVNVCLASPGQAAFVIVRHCSALANVGYLPSSSICFPGPAACSVMTPSDICIPVKMICPQEVATAVAAVQSLRSVPGGRGGSHSS